MGEPPSEDRRDSHRIPFTFQVREPSLGGSYEAREGNLAIGGCYFEAFHPPAGSALEVRFVLPFYSEEIRARGDVLRVTREGERFGVHVRFTEIPLDAELALARYLQGAPVAP